MLSGILKFAKLLISNNSTTFCNSHNFLTTAYDRISFAILPDYKQFFIQKLKLLK